MLFCLFWEVHGAWCLHSAWDVKLHVCSSQNAVLYFYYTREVIIQSLWMWLYGAAPASCKCFNFLLRGTCMTAAWATLPLLIKLVCVTQINTDRKVKPFLFTKWRFSAFVTHNFTNDILVTTIYLHVI
jgi:hypothetical protein